MITLLRKIAVIGVSFAVVAGCDRSSHPSGNFCAIDVFGERTGFVLAKINGDKVTAGDFRRRYEVEKAIYRHTNRNKPEAQLDVAVAGFMKKRQLLILAEIVNQRLVKQYIAANKIEIPRKERESFLDRCLAQLKFRKVGIKAAAEQLGVDVGFFEDQLLMPLRIEYARNHFGGGPFSVTEKEVDEGLARQDRYYEQAVASNAVTYVTCSNVLKMVTTEGRDFKETGLKCGQYEPEEAELWDRLEYKEIEAENKAMAEWAFKAPIGSIGGPFELDDGLSIVKILERSEGTKEDSLASAGVADVTLARITFYLVVPEPEPRTREFVKETLANWKAEQAQKGLFKELHSEMKLEYPHGTNFVFASEAKGETK